MHDPQRAASRQQALDCLENFLSTIDQREPDLWERYHFQTALSRFEVGDFGGVEVAAEYAQETPKRRAFQPGHSDKLDRLDLAMMRREVRAARSVP